MKIIVDIKNYTPFSYSPYLENGNGVEAPTNPNYVVGQVVVVKREENDYEEFAVVLGCIDVECDGEVRLDLCGMTSIDLIRPANICDFSNKNIHCIEKLKKEVQGYKVNYDWNTYELTIEEPNI